MFFVATFFPFYFSSSKKIYREYEVFLFSSSILHEEHAIVDEDDRYVEEVDLCIVGAGPCGLSAAIKFKQLALENGNDELRVCVLDKASYIGAHTLSGACIETKALDELIPDWASKGAPISTLCADEYFYLLYKKIALRLPLFKRLPLHNEGNFVVRLGNVVKWLGEQAESLGVEVYPGFPASRILYNEERNRVLGVFIGDVGIAKDGSHKDSFEKGMCFKAKITMFCEGCHGHLTKELYKSFDLRKNCEPQVYGIGFKELWQVKKEEHRAGTVIHTVGWPLPYKNYGGSFIYHYGEGDDVDSGESLIALGYVLGLDYQNPYINPYKTFQKLKTHPMLQKLLSGGKRVSYGARALNEGGYQCIPKLFFPGGCVAGCSPGFLNVPKIKGTHYAMKSGMIAAEASYEVITGKSQNLSIYGERIHKSWIMSDLHSVRNIKPSFSSALGIYGGLLYTGLLHFATLGREPWTFKHKKKDSERLLPAKNFERILYPEPDGVYTFDLASSVALTGTNHESDQPVHLTLGDHSIPLRVNYEVWKGPEERFCPAGVYEYIKDNDEVKFQISAQNCIHCKTCDIKDPSQNINWVTPEGGGGPAYNGM